MNGDGMCPMIVNVIVHVSPLKGVWRYVVGGVHVKVAAVISSADSDAPKAAPCV